MYKKSVWKGCPAEGLWRMVWWCVHNMAKEQIKRCSGIFN